eukprot:c24533_g1_i1 orf=345-1193(-)
MKPNNETVVWEVSSINKELSFVDRMYQKLESVCVEVDKDPSLFVQETTKYVEKHMSVVGTNVRKFCADFIQDLLPSSDPPSDPPVEKGDPSGLCPQTLCHFETVVSNATLQRTSNLPLEGSAGADVLEALTTNQETGSTLQMDAKDCSIADKVLHDNISEHDSETRMGHTGYGLPYHQENVAEQVLGDEDLEDGELMLKSVPAFAANDHSCFCEGENCDESVSVIAEQTEGDQEQCAQWFVSEEERTLFKVRNSPATSSIDCYVGDQAQSTVDDFEFEWELI